MNNNIDELSRAAFVRRLKSSFIIADILVCFTFLAFHDIILLALAFKLELG